MEDQLKEFADLVAKELRNMGISDDLDKTQQLEYFYEYFPDRVAQYTAVFNQMRKNKRKETRANK